MFGWQPSKVREVAAVIAIGRGHEPPTALGLQVVLAHEAADLLGIHDHALMAKLSAYASNSSQIAVMAVTISA